MRFDVIRYRLKELIADKSFKEGRVITLAEVASESGVHRSTLSKLSNEKGYKTNTEILDKLCKYFECETGEVVVYIPE